MIDKVKIRKVESSIDDVLARVEKLLEISEKLNRVYNGTLVKEICTSIGLKELEFWEIRYDNEGKFNEKFVILTNHLGMLERKLIMRRSTFEKQKAEKRNS